MKPGVKTILWPLGLFIFGVFVVSLLFVLPSLVQAPKTDPLNVPQATLATVEQPGWSYFTNYVLTGYEGENYHPSEPVPWSDFPAECLWYFVPMIPLHLVMLGIGWLILALRPAEQPSRFWIDFRRLGLFLGLFLVAASLFNGIWSCWIYSRFYESSDYVFGFLPFYPLTEAWLEIPQGGDGKLVMGISFFQLEGLWLLFAGGTWGVTIFTYRRVRRRWPHIFAAVGPAQLGESCTEGSRQ